MGRFWSEILLGRSPDASANVVYQLVNRCRRFRTRPFWSCREATSLRRSFSNFNHHLLANFLFSSFSLREPELQTCSDHRLHTNLIMMLILTVLLLGEAAIAAIQFTIASGDCSGAGVFNPCNDSMLGPCVVMLQTRTRRGVANQKFRKIDFNCLDRTTNHFCTRILHIADSICSA